jgi:hypothetical protein
MLTRTDSDQLTPKRSALRSGLRLAGDIEESLESTVETIGDDLDNDLELRHLESSMFNNWQ